MTLVETTQGTCLGSVADGVFSFKGIPYAQAPFGALRMKPPVPHSGWSGERDCTQYGPTVPKGPYPPPFDTLLPEPIIPGEECLNLNIWTPSLTDSSLPVLVWIHGGAFVNGTGSAEIYSGRNFARDGVVTVTINYRLGPDGFLYLGDGISNLGIQDQLLALKWVQQNIGKFGGDPDKVTVAGESAGAASVGTLLSMSQSEGLFRGAIMQSGAASHWLTPDTAKKVANYLAERLGIEPNREAFAEVAVDELVSAYMALSVEAQTIPDPMKWGEIVRNSMIFEPVVDGDFIAAPPLDSLKNGAGSEVAVLIGTNEQEFNLFTVPAGIYDLVDDNFVNLAATLYGLGTDAVEVYRQIFPKVVPGELMGRIATDWFFRIPAIRLAEARSKVKSSTYCYEFRWKSPLFDGKLGSCHAVEIPFVFDVLDAPMVADLVGESPSGATAAVVHKGWVDFVTNLNPGWDRYDPDTRRVRVFGAPDEVEEDPWSATRRLWDGLR